MEQPTPDDINEYAHANGWAEVWRSWRDTILQQGRNVDNSYMKFETLPQRDRLLDTQIAYDVINDFLAWYYSHGTTRAQH